MVAWEAEHERVCRELDAAADAAENVTYDADKAAVKKIFDECVAELVEMIDEDTATDATFLVPCCFCTLTFLHQC